MECCLLKGGGDKEFCSSQLMQGYGSDAAPEAQADGVCSVAWSQSPVGPARCLKGQVFLLNVDASLA